jgi:SAM-dependent methyltransferase
LPSASFEAGVPAISLAILRQLFPFPKNVIASILSWELSMSVVIIAVNVLHHLTYPLKFLNAFVKIFPPGGRLFLVESHCSFLLKLLIEMYGYRVDPFNESIPVNNPDDPTEENNVVGNLFFRKTMLFEERVLGFKIKKRSCQELFQFLILGGASRSFLPLNLVNKLDEKIIQLLYPVALRKYIILERV